MREGPICPHKSISTSAYSMLKLDVPRALRGCLRLSKGWKGKQCDIVFQKGKLKTLQWAGSVLQVEDAFAAFQKVRGTPTFWQQARNELEANVS
jgi:hypothetical protein